MVGTFQDFLNFRNKELAGDGKTGMYVFNNTIAKRIYDAKPQTVAEFEAIEGIKKGGERSKKYAEKIVRYFHESRVFG